MDITRLKQPRCFVVYALAPETVSAAEANRAFNAFLADRSLPLAVYHDHFIGEPGGMAIFFADSDEERHALASAEDLHGWRIEVRPLIYSRSPAAFDEQIAFTLRAYRGQSWNRLRRENRPVYGNPQAEAETARESG